MLDFFSKPFAIAGMIAAAGPILIHLLNRRRFRVVNWAAMDFLREALQRNRKILQMRDLILLLLRVFCVLMVGFALARPFFQTSSGESLFQQTWPWLVGAVALILAIIAVISAVRLTKVALGIAALVCLAFAGWGFSDLIAQQNQLTSDEGNQREPVHAVLVVDNSLSMGYETLEGSLLEQAKSKAADFIDRLPPQSFVSVIPLCGSETAISGEAYRSKEDARDALQSIEVVDRRGTASLAVQQAILACEKVPELLAKRVVFLSDQQAGNWPADSMRAELAKLPELQIAKVGVDKPENVWLSDFHVQDGIADIETPSTFIVAVEYQGPQSVRDVQVTLKVDGVSVASQTVDLEPDQTRQLEFQYQIDVPAEPGRPQFIHATAEVQTATIQGDRLASDNKRHLVIPVVAALPVVFVDSLGSKEDVIAGEVGETYPLRRYLAPRLSREEFHRQLVQVRHLTIGELDQTVLEDARMVVIGGVKSPQDSVPLLRQYVQQGGQLVITGGAEFDPAEWQQLAWLDGRGILPSPLLPEAYGKQPDELDLPRQLDQLKRFFLDFQTMQHPYFVLSNVPANELASWYRLTIFFKALQADVTQATIQDMIKRETKRLEDEQEFLAKYVSMKSEFESKQKSGALTAEETSELSRLETRFREISPQWLLWKTDEGTTANTSIEQRVQDSLPQVLARYDAKGTGELEDQALPFLVERRIGRGQVLLFTSGTYSSWNTLSEKNSNISMFGHILRKLIEDTLPERNFETGRPVTLPAEADRRLQYTLTRPDGQQQNLTVDAVAQAEVIDQNRFVVTVPTVFQSGAYQVAARRAESLEETTASSSAPPPLLRFAANGPAGESDLSLLSRRGLEDRLGSPGENGMWRWIDANEPLSLEGAQIRGRDYWKLFVMLVLAGLILEMLVLAWPSLKQSVSSTDGDGSSQPLAEPTP